jgi:hypothetical protein
MKSGFLTAASIAALMCLGRGVAAEDLGVYFGSTTGDLFRSDLSASSVHDFVLREFGIGAPISVGVQSGRVYWFDPIEQRLMRAWPSGEGVEVLRCNGINAPRWIDVAEELGYVYWAETDSPEVLRASLHGEEAPLVMFTAPGELYAVEVDELHLTIYVTGSWQSESLIKTDLDGEEVEVLESTTGSSPSALQIAPSLGLVYWVDGKLKRADLNGESVLVLPALPDGSSSGAFAVDESGEKLYRASTASKTIYVSDLEGLNPVALVTLPGPGTIDQVQFDAISGQLLAGEQNRAIWAIDPAAPVPQLAVAQPHSSMPQVWGIDVDEATGRVFAAANGNLSFPGVCKIWSIEPDGSDWRSVTLQGALVGDLRATSGTEVVEVCATNAFYEVNLETGSVEKLFSVANGAQSFDRRGSGEWYWILNGVQIRRANADGTRQQLFGALPDEAWDLFIDPITDSLYWLVQGPDGALMRSPLDRFAPTPALTGLSAEYRMHFDAAARDVYWADLSAGMWRWNLDAGGEPAFIDVPATMVGLAIGPNPSIHALADLNDDDEVDGTDISEMLDRWGDCDCHAPCTADLNGDGVVDGADLGELLVNWT